MDTTELRAGMRSCVPMLIGVIPFGLVAGATPAAEGFGLAAALGMSTIIFAGASQLAVVDVLAGGGSAIVAALAAWTINLRMLLYSASIAPYLSHEPLPRRLGVAYLLVDQNYALSVAHWMQRPARAKAEFAIGGGLFLGVFWVICTAIGAVVGTALPEELPLDFAVPLVFLVLLVPALATRPAIVAAAVGGLAAVVSAELGASHSSIMIGAAAGIVAGVLAEVAVGPPSTTIDPGGQDQAGESR
ncbi:MAG: AzlC family ABC transporter permease [Acidimicrobiia bacterium]|nr:AzlC family ABC transporter permease [Acidimicrobiia bacterium]